MAYRMKTKPASMRVQRAPEKVEKKSVRRVRTWRVEPRKPKFQRRAFYRILRTCEIRTLERRPLGVS